MRSAKFIAVALVACTVTGCAFTVGAFAALGCALLYKRAFNSSPSSFLICILTVLAAVPGMWAGLNAIRFHQLVRWAVK
jgi:hypothetical protein